MPIRARYLLLVGTVVLVSIITLLLLGSQLASGRFTDNQQQALSAVATHVRERVLQSMRMQRERFDLLASRTQKRLSLQEFVDTGEPAALRKIERIISDALRSSPDLVSISVVAENGTVIASTGAGVTGTHVAALLAPAKRGADPAAFDFQNEFGTARFDRLAGVAEGRPQHLLSGPLILEGRRIGGLLVVTDTAYLQRIVRPVAGLAGAIQTGIGRRDDNGGLEIIAASGASPRRLDIQELDGLPLFDAVQGRAGFRTDTRDFRGQRVIALMRPIPELGWGFVVQLNRESAILSFWEFLWQPLALVFGLLLVMLGASTWFVHRLSRDIGALSADFRALDAAPDASGYLRAGGDEIASLRYTYDCLAASLDSERSTYEQQLRENAELVEQVRDQALQDPLTGLGNRRLFEDALHKEIERSQRARRPLSLLLVDLDHFKQVNDTHGHLVGDEVLRRMAGCMTECCRQMDIPARFGGEEFVIGLPETSIINAMVIADRLREAVSELALQNEQGQPFRVSCSVGVSTWDAGDTLEDLLRRADEAVYRAKQQGRNRVCKATPVAA